MPPVRVDAVALNRRLLSLWTEMVFQESRHAERTVPSAYTIIKAEYGYAGTRQEVMDRVCEDVRKLQHLERPGQAG